MPVKMYPATKRVKQGGQQDNLLCEEPRPPPPRPEATGRSECCDALLLSA